MTKSIEEIKKEATDPKILQQVDSWYWSFYNKIRLRGIEFKLKSHVYQLEWLRSKARNKVYKKAAQMGGPLDINTPIPTLDGWKTMECLNISDIVFDENGMPCNVMSVSPIFYDRDCYKIVFSDGSVIRCDGEHLWSVTNEKNYRYRKNETINTLKISGSYKNKDRNIYAIDIAKPLNLLEEYLLVEPYVLGLWLGDGNSYSAQITADVKDTKEYDVVLKSLGVDFEIRQKDKRYPDIRNIKLNNYHYKLNALGVLKNKHIPFVYLRASYKQRLELLQGLMDSDGHIDKRGSCCFYNNNLNLIKQVYELLMTLGLKAKWKFKGDNCNWDRTGFSGNKHYQIYFRAYKEVPVFKLKRKLSRQLSRDGNRTSETERRRIVSVEKIPSLPVRCIKVNSVSNLFLCGESFIPTHNTEAEVLNTLHGMIYGKYKQGVLYLFPTREDVTDFSKGRFQPLITENPCIGKWVSDTDASNIKRIGGSMLYLRGAKSSGKIEGEKESSSQLKSVPVDKLVLDEKDEMSAAMIALALERMSHSEIKEVVSISTPTIPLYGIDKDYNESDQRVWMIKCGKCNEYTCLELEFPECIIDLGKGHIRACKRCKSEIYPDDGQWVAKHPGREVAGWWISQLNSAYNLPGDILKMYNDPGRYNTTLAEVYNSKLGMAYIDAENRLTRGDIYACCGQGAMMMSTTRNTSMGVDVGKVLHVVIGYKLDDNRYKVVYMGRVPEFEDLHDLALRYNTKVVVIDMEPETRKAREFKDLHTDCYKVLLCDYQERLKTSEKRDEQQGLITVRRTETCDMTHGVVSKRMIEYPRRNTEVEIYAEHMSNIAKMLVEDKVSGSRYYRYRGTGDDHYFHATNYYLLGCRDFMISADYDNGYDFKYDERQNRYDPFEHLVARSN